VQKQIYQGVGGTMEYSYDNWKKFAEKVGWRKGGKWLEYSELTFSDKHYTGHLPTLLAVHEDLGFRLVFRWGLRETCRL
jgi:hypothetical protein